MFSDSNRFDWNAFVNSFCFNSKIIPLRNTSHIGLLKSLERVQRWFVRLIAYKRRRHFVPNNPSVHTSQSSILTILDLESLVSRCRYHVDICLLSKFVEGLISCPETLQSLRFHVPQHLSRHCPRFSISIRCTFYGYNYSINHVSRECNEIKNFELFDTRTLYPSSIYFLSI